MKKITIISGVADDSYRELEQALGNMSNTKVFLARKMNINYCCGCWDCWVKTPGLCRHQDDMPEVLRSIINSDLFVFVSPVHMGFVSSLTKKISDKIIPLVHPYIGIFHGEMHHLKRYKRYPKLGLLLLDRGGQPQEVHDIITQAHKRMALNLKTTLAFSIMSDGNPKEVEHALSSF